MFTNAPVINISILKFRNHQRQMSWLQADWKMIMKTVLNMIVWFVSGYLLVKLSFTLAVKNKVKKFIYVYS